MADTTFKVLAIYKFVKLTDYLKKRLLFKDFCVQHNIKGTLLFAKEGINGTIAGTSEAIDLFYVFLTSFKEFEGGEYKFSNASTMPFYRLKVRLKKEIVTLGVPGIEPTQAVGTYVEPQDWNALISDPNVVVVDTRNKYEFAIGTFRGSLNPDTQSFNEFPQFVKNHLDPKVHKRIAMHCTGGIRCEKATAYMISQGFEEVYHLKGGILGYLEKVPEPESLWEGECFVFDRRVAVKEGVSEGAYKLCFGCRYPLSDADLKSPHYEAGVSCSYCYHQQPEKSKNRARERHKQVQMAKTKSMEHIGYQQK